MENDQLDCLENAYLQKYSVHEDSTRIFSTSNCFVENEVTHLASCKTKKATHWMTPSMYFLYFLVSGQQDTLPRL
jgi:hypothetical protein